MDHEINQEKDRQICPQSKCRMPGVPKQTCCFKGCYHLFRCLIAHRTCLNSDCLYHLSNIAFNYNISLEELLGEFLFNALDRVNEAERLTRIFTDNQYTPVAFLVPDESLTNYQASDAGDYLIRGFLYHIAGQILEAKLNFQKCIEINPNFIPYIPDEYLN